MGSVDGVSGPVEGTGAALHTSGRAPRDYSHLKPWQFQPGHAPHPRGGRPKGSKDALTVILEAAPHKARQYVRSKAPAVLVDARKWIMPIESDAPSPSLSIDRMTIIHELTARGVALPDGLRDDR